MPPISIKGIVNFDMVLDEMWAVAQEEMNFLLEASNIEEFAGNNRDVAFVATPKLYLQVYHITCTCHGVYKGL